MTATADLLVEIGTEELPPKALPELMDAFGTGIAAGLESAGLPYDGLEPYASPRRLAVVVTALASRQPDREVEDRGPPVRVAFDDAGEPTAAARAFAKKCGVEVSELGRTRSDKGEWLSYRRVETGRTMSELLPGIVTSALDGLPIPRRMRWGAGDAEFVRPVHWVVLLYGDTVIEAEILGCTSGRETRGHRFLAPAPLSIRRPSEYLSTLEQDGHVLADFEAREKRIRAGVAAAAAECGGEPVGSDALYDEVAALVEWPVPMAGSFDEAFLRLPREVIVATLTSHQRYFPVQTSAGDLLAAFVAVANIDSLAPEKVRDGNERVIRPRLADAAFFWEADRRVRLAGRMDSLGSVVYQRELGSMLDRSRRVAGLAARLAKAAGATPEAVERAALLGKCDLVTGMVGEFPELQGTMGSYYAAADGEPAEVAAAIGEQYLPRFAGDRLPATPTGRCLAVADKLDALCGIFALGRKPSGNRDPFGLRRSALGMIRIVIETQLDVSLTDLIRASVDSQPVSAEGDVATEVYDFVLDRLKGYYLEQDGFTAEMFEAVRQRRPGSLLDFDERLRAVAAFVDLEAAASLAAANKRIANILRQAGGADSDGLEPALLHEDAEQSLYAALSAARESVTPLLDERRYADALTRLAALREPVDRFFDDVMVMADEDDLRRNRLALLAALREQFLDVADISRLSIGKA